MQSQEVISWKQAETNVILVTTPRIPILPELGVQREKFPVVGGEVYQLPGLQRHQHQVPSEEKEMIENQLIKPKLLPILFNQSTNPPLEMLWRKKPKTNPITIYWQVNSLLITYFKCPIPQTSSKVEKNF
jgi:hypothetical protein